MSERSDGCATHPDALAEGTCAVCARAVCATCAAYDVDGRVCCEACGRAEEDRSRSLGSTLLAFVGVGYLATLAVGVAIFHARPFVGGIAAIAAIALGRVLQIVIRPPVVIRRLRQS
jgi:predicted nucleic acid-binding Zn ribbon protein